MQTGKIVFVEDNIHDAELIRLSFKHTRFAGELIRFDSGPTFLEYLHSHDPYEIQFVILDMDMPRMTGLEVLKQLNKKYLKKFPVIFFTSSSNPTNIQCAKELKADAYIKKPTNFDEFQDSVKDIWRFYGELNLMSRITEAIAV